MKTRFITITAVMTALIALLTRVIQIPTPITRGYLNPGDILVLLSGFLFGPRPGFFAGGLGSMIADILTGYPFFYVTFIVKGLEGAVPGLSIWRYNPWLSRWNNLLRLLVGAIPAALVMAGGYFLFQWLIFGWAAATAAFLPNILQGDFGIVGTLLIYSALDPVFKRWKI
ncbi:MAG: ECF transporter S component [Candidatus Eremiobacteraeota bacterium]|nr:ECF transporter S component [Candidatus Eremiobacteraeota bacterium]